MSCDVCITHQDAVHAAAREQTTSEERVDDGHVALQRHEHVQEDRHRQVELLHEVVEFTQEQAHLSTHRTIETENDR